jgi:hypothetical protein
MEDVAAVGAGAETADAPCKGAVKKIARAIKRQKQRCIRRFWTEAGTDLFK